VRHTLSVVFAPDSFKGSLTSVVVARALAEGWARARPADRLLLAPLADGGEGTLGAIAAAGGWRRLETAASDPIGRPIEAGWLRSHDGTRAVVELAEASGLTRLAADERDPRGATTVGTGEVLRAALDSGVRRIDLGIGGSATTDGGWGILHALGARRIVAVPEAVGDRRVGSSAGFDDQVAGGPIDLDGLDPRLAGTRLRIACDVTNPLLGEHGAAAVYGPQKGASPADVAFLDARLAVYADALEAASGRHERDTPGAGAAGGTGFGLLCLRDRFDLLELVAGVDLVMEETDLDGKLVGADIVVTGEGRIDAQTAFGKTALGVARRAQAAGVRCIAVGGGVQPEGRVALEAFGVEVVPVHTRPIPLSEAMAAGQVPLIACGERLAQGIDRPLAR
jgi:glycerate kinase